MYKIIYTCCYFVVETIIFTPFPMVHTSTALFGDKEGLKVVQPPESYHNVLFCTCTLPASVTASLKVFTLRNLLSKPIFSSFIKLG